MSDYFMRMIDQIGEMAAHFFDVDLDDDIHVSDVAHTVDEQLTAYLSVCLAEGKYNQGEDFLFTYAEKDRSTFVMYAGRLFYFQLLEKSDEELEKHDFSRAEVYQGVKDFALLFQEDEDE